jgi:hypothetical protein
MSGVCEPAGWALSSTCKDKASDAPVWWRTACIGYDLNQNASHYVPYDVASQAVADAFGVWRQAGCSADGSMHPSFDVRDLGPIPCASAFYDMNGGPNQNVIVFHDDVWPNDALAIALTTVTSNIETGEIYDADIELNTADYMIMQLPPGAPSAGEFDLQSVLTHEIGHFLGLAHSPLADAVMYATGDSAGGTMKRALAAEDELGICAIYPSNGTRSVSMLVDPSGSTAEGACDPTPHHGFSATCP